MERIGLESRFENKIRDLDEKLFNEDFVDEEEVIRKVNELKGFVDSLGSKFGTIPEIEERYKAMIDNMVGEIEQIRIQEIEPSRQEYQKYMEDILARFDEMLNNGVLHLIQNGENLSEISKLYYGDGNLYPRLMKLGYKQDIQSGNILLLPQQLGDAEMKQEYRHLDPYVQIERYEQGHDIYYNLEGDNKPKQANEQLQQSPNTVEIGGNLYEILGTQNIPTEEEVSEKISEFLETPRGQKIKLVLDTLSIYIDYLGSLNAHLEFKGIRKLDNDIDGYIGKVKEISNKINLNILNSDLMTDQYLVNTIDDIFNLGGQIDSIGFDGVKQQLPIIQNFLKGVINNDQKNISQTKFDMLRLLRDLDKNDGSGEYNISESIQNMLLDDVLNNAKLSENPQIKERFEKIKQEFKNPQEFIDGLVKSFQDKTENWEEVMGKFNSYFTDKSQDYLISHGIDIKGAVQEIRSFLESRLGIKAEREVKNTMGEAIVREWEAKGHKYTEQDLQKALLQAYGDYEAKVKKQLQTFVKAKGVEWTLKAFDGNIEQARAQDPRFDMYANIEGLGIWELSDKTRDGLKILTQELAIQVALMFISGSIGNIASKGAMTLKGWKTVNTTGRVASIGAVDGTAFHLSYNTLHNIREGNNWYRNLDNPKDWAKDILFITALRGLNSIPIKGASLGIRGEGKNLLDTVEDLVIMKGAKLTFNDKVWNTIIANGVSIGVETIVLVGLGSGINIMFGDGIINDPNEIIHIIAMVIGLRMVNKGVGGGNYLIKQVNGEMEVQQLQKVETRIKQETDKINKINTQVQKGEYVKISDTRGGETRANGLDEIKTKKEAMISKLEIQKKEYKKLIEEPDRPPNTGNEVVKLMAGVIPLSELFNRGQELEEYEKIRDKLIKDALTKQGSENLLKNEYFNKLKEDFITDFLNKPVTQLIIKENNWDVEKVKQGLREDFDDMIKQLGSIEEISKNMTGNTEADRKKEAIKALFLLNEDINLGEALLGMVDQYYDKLNNKNNIKNKINKL